MSSVMPSQGGEGAVNHCQSHNGVKKGCKKRFDEGDGLTQRGYS